MKKLYVWLRRGSIFVFIGMIMFMIWDIYRIPDYNGGEAFVSISPDKRYKVSHVYPVGSTPSVYLLTDLADHQVKAMVIKPHWWDGFQVRMRWDCNKQKIHCTAFYYDINREADDIVIPPTLWQQLHAWLTIKIKGLENPQLTEIEQCNYCD